MNGPSGSERCALLVAIQAALAGAPAAPVPPDQEPAPWQAWLLVALGRHVERQRWLMRVWREHLEPPPPPVPAYTRERGWCTEDPEVPGVPGWRFRFQCEGLLLIAPDGEEIEARDHGDDGLTIEPEHFADRIQSIVHPAHPERRLLAFLPTHGVIVAAAYQLLSEGLLVPGEGGSVFRAAPEIEAFAEALAAVDFADAAVCARWDEHLGDCTDPDIARPRDRAPGDHADPDARTLRAIAQREAYKRYLLAGLERVDADAYIEPLEAALLPAELVDACARLIDGPVDRRAAHAIARLDARPDCPICPAVYRLLLRADPARDSPDPVYFAAKYLFRRGIAREHAAAVASAFARADDVRGGEGNPLVAMLALLLLEHAPSHALPAIRHALRSSTLVVRTRIAAALIVLAQPWCVRELLLALDDALTFEASATVRFALRLLSERNQAGDEARLAVERWESTHVMRAYDTPGGKQDDAAEATVGFFIEKILIDHALRGWGDAVRVGIDPDFDRIVWA